MSCRILQGDVLDRLRDLPDESVQCVVTSPPYWGLRDYGVEGQIGLEATPQEFLAKMVAVFREVRRVLRADGTCWVNMGDAYAGSWGAQSRGNQAPGAFLRGGVESLSKRQIEAHPKWQSKTGSLERTPGLKPKDLIGMPWRLAFALQEDGWWLRQDIIWSKPNPMPESVTDRCTKAHEYIFLLTKSARYFYDAEAVKEDAATAGNTIKMADGWDTGEGGHGTVHRDGRQKGESKGAVQSATRNKRSVWEIATEAFAEAHFATFPTKLVEPCLLAGTSERGCCGNCGAPWERVMEVGYDNPGNRTTNGNRSLANRDITAGFAQRLEKRTQTVGWKAGCTCGAETVPCTVLDPFNGAGTTGLVARRFGRNYVGVELNPEYAAMAQRRITADAPMFNHVEVHP